MPLNIEKIESLVEEKPRENQIREAKAMAARLRFHIDPRVDNFHHHHHDHNGQDNKTFPDHHDNFYLPHFLNWIGLNIKDRQKQRRFFLFLHNGPYPTVDFTEKIWNKRDRIFRAQDAFTRTEFKDDSLIPDSEEYLKTICFREFMDNVVRNHEKTSPNSFVVIDLPRFELDPVTGEPINLPEFPEPFPVMVDIRAVIDYNRDNKELTHIIYDAEPSIEFPDGSIIAVDRLAYWVIPKKKEKPQFNQGFPIPHNLGFVPAVQIGKKQLKKQDNIVMSNILVSSLGELDTLLLNQISKKYLDGYMNPIIEMLEEECDYKDADGHHCESGIINFQRSLGDGNFEPAQHPCPSCEARGMMFPGTVIKRPQRKNDDPDDGDAVKFITPDVGFLQYTREEIEAKKNDIVSCTVGVMVEGDDQAKNIPQVEAGTESRMDVLLSESENRAMVKEDILNILLTIRYRDLFVRVKVHGGTQFLMRTAKQIREDIEAAKKIGASQTELMKLKEQLIRTEFANDKQEMSRQLLLIQLEPVPLSNLEQANNIWRLGLMSKEDLAIKANFANFIMRFEREQANILEFFALSSFDVKVKLIKETLEGYARDAITEQEEARETIQQETADIAEATSRNTRQ